MCDDEEASCAFMHPTTLLLMTPEAMHKCTATLLYDAVQCQQLQLFQLRQDCVSAGE
jgi:hypothetical protein